MQFIIWTSIIQEWPIKSKLDPVIYGPQESAITEDMINQEIGGIMKVDEVSTWKIRLTTVQTCNA